MPLLLYVGLPLAGLLGYKAGSKFSAGKLLALALIVLAIVYLWRKRKG